MSLISQYTAEKGNVERHSIWLRNPVLSQLLGLSPLLAMSTTLTKGLVLGLISAVVCFLSVSIHALVYRYVEDRYRFIWYLFVCAGLTTTIDLAMQTTLFPLHRELGLYLPLVACNFAILLHMESRNNDFINVDCSNSLLPTASHCFGILLAMSLFSALREFLTFGTLFGDLDLIKPDPSNIGAGSLYNSSGQWLGFLSLQPGVFILAGLFLASKKAIDNQLKNRFKDRQKTIKKVERARVTGKI